MNEALTDIASRTKVSWRRIAKVNKLKRPYVIKYGQVIRVPKQAKKLSSKDSSSQLNNNKQSRVKVGTSEKKKVNKLKR